MRASPSSDCSLIVSFEVDENFGDYLAHLVGWQEGAALFAYRVIERIASQRKSWKIARVPAPRLYLPGFQPKCLIAFGGTWRGRPGGGKL